MWERRRRRRHKDDLAVADLGRIEVVLRNARAEAVIMQRISSCASILS